MSNWILIQKWWARTETVEQAHFRASIKYRWLHYFFGGLPITVTTVASVFQGTDYIDKHYEWIVTLLGVCSPILAALVTFLEYPKRSGAHHNAAARFSSLKRSLQVLAANYDCSDKKVVTSSINDIKRKWDQLTLDAPALNKKDWSEIGPMDKKIEETMLMLREDNKASPNNLDC